MSIGPGVDPAFAGPLLFARYAYPPNRRGFCGPSDHRELFDYAAAGVVDRGLRELARSFTGPWPYLTTIAGAAGISDPFDVRVVEAYWVGNDLLDRVATPHFAAAVLDRFKRVAGPGWSHLAEAVPAGGVPHHSFHVFEVYPWVGLLAEHRGGHPLHILDRCRIRWGQVVELAGDDVVVRSQPLTWDGGELRLGAPAVESCVLGLEGVRVLDDLQVDDWVSLHWDWVCDRLSERQLRSLRAYTARQLAVTNRKVGHPGPAMALT